MIVRVERPDGLYRADMIALLVTIGLVCCALAKLVEWCMFKAVHVSVDASCLYAFSAGQFILGWNRSARAKTAIAGICLGLFSSYVFPQLHAALPISLGLVTIFCLGGAAFVSVAHRKQALYIMGAGSLVLVGQQLANTGQYLSTTEILSLDNRAYLVDQSLGFDAINIVTNFFYRLPYFTAYLVFFAINQSYNNILLVMACVVLMHLRKRSSEWAVTLTAFLLAGGIGAALYHICFRQPCLATLSPPGPCFPISRR